MLPTASTISQTTEPPSTVDQATTSRASLTMYVLRRKSSVVRLNRNSLSRFVSHHFPCVIFMSSFDRHTNSYLAKNRNSTTIYSYWFLILLLLLLLFSFIALSFSFLFHYLHITSDLVFIHSFLSFFLLFLKTIFISR